MREVRFLLLYKILGVPKKPNSNPLFDISPPLPIKTFRQKWIGLGKLKLLRINLVLSLSPIYLISSDY